MKLLLDTCVISDIVKSIGKTRKKFIDAMLKDEIAISTITLFEIEYGLNLNQAVRQKIGDDIEKICSTLQIIQFSKEAAYAAAAIKAKLKEEGKPIGGYDLLIAATGLAEDMTVVTANTDEFKRVENLKIINWRV